MNTPQKSPQKRVVQVAIGHPADDGRVRAKIARALVRGGYDSHIICPGGVAGKADDGVTIHPHATSENRIERVRRQSAIAKSAADLRPDVLHIHEPIMLGSVIKRRGTSKVVWDVHENYEVVLASRQWIPKPLRRVVWRLWDFQERRLLKHVDLILAATPPVAERYLPLHDNVVVVPNLTEIEIYDGPHDWSKPHALFAGSIFENRGLLQVIEALGQLRREGLRLPMTIAGSVESPEFQQRLQGAIDAEGIADDVKLVGMLPRTEVVELAKRATIGVVAHLPESQGDIAWPVKMFEFMASGLPLVYTTLGAMVHLAGDSEIGVAVAPRDIPALAAAFRKLATNPELAQRCGMTGRELTESKYHWKTVEPLLLEKYAELCR
jgi:glycosyltransferase involved in cell wall biosynthesis